MRFIKSILSISIAALMVLSCSESQDFDVEINSHHLKIQFFSPDIIRVLRSPDKIVPQHQLWVANEKPARVKYTKKETDEAIILKTSAVSLTIEKHSGAIIYRDKEGNVLLAEKEINEESFRAITLADNSNSYEIKQEFELTDDEAIYGLGQYQEGVMNYRGSLLTLKQENKIAVNPYLVSTNGYGLLWNNYSISEFSDKGNTYFKSNVGDNIDYYFMAGHNIDDLISDYRILTGKTPLFGRWAYGFWQCRERYTSQDELIAVLQKFRDLKVPIDNIVQDWRYWGIDNTYWNSTVFDTVNYPDAKGMIDKVHKMNAHIMFSVWPSFGVGSDIYKELDSHSMLYDFNTWPEEYVKVYDAFNSEANAIVWKHMDKNMFRIGADAWWMDAVEPEYKRGKGQLDSTSTALGNYRRFWNGYTLNISKSTYNGQRAEDNNKRVYILTRSAFIGQQRYASSTWSGDIHATWDVYRKQISAGLNFAMSGIPYWTTDIGAFYTSEEYPLGVNDLAYQELYTRWFQFGTFCPIFRSHGTNTPREIFQFGDKGHWAFDTQLKFINLRYRLMPYIYSTAWQVTNNNYTMMRGLAMDFAQDKNVHNIDNQYMFGKSILVCPVTDKSYAKRTDKLTKATMDFSEVKKQSNYLPEQTDWFDFWTGERLKGGTTVSCEIPIDIMPLYVKAGSILPMGQFIQHTAEDEGDKPVELRIYTGANADFVLYEDENDNYNYENGVFSEIPISWNEDAQMLTIGNRTGSFDGMKKKKQFNIIWVDKDNGTDINISEKPHRVIEYSGLEIETHKN